MTTSGYLSSSKRANPKNQQKILTDVLQTIQSTKKSAIAVFDLDSTLFDNRPRQARILREYGATIQHKTLSAAKSTHIDGWDLSLSMKRVGLTSKELETLFPVFRSYWRERFFTSEYCVEDEPILGAQEFLQHVQKVGGSVAYVTGRDISMKEGTIESFQKHNFPRPDQKDVYLFMKPDYQFGDDAWKEHVHERLKRLGTVCAAFDNEPAHINAYNKSFSSACTVHLDTDHSARPIKVFSHIPSIENFSYQSS